MGYSQRQQIRFCDNLSIEIPLGERSMASVSKRELTKQRRAYEKQAIRAVGVLVKGTGWKKKKNSIFCAREGYLFAASLEVWLNELKVVWRLEVKPMDVDPVFWSIMNMEENLEEPLSLRVWGAFVCSAIPVAESEASSSALSGDEMARDFLTWAENAAGGFLQENRQRPFSDIVKNQINYRERGAYAATLICSLITESCLEEALKVAVDFSSGKRQSVVVHSSEGRSFFERASAWLRDRTSGCA